PSDHHRAGTRHCARSRTRDLARGNRGDRQARAADRADAARPSRDDDHRPRADRAARRRRGGGGGAGAADPVLRLRARHGADVRGRSLGVAGVWGAPTAHGAPGVARGTLGCGHPRHSDERGAALGRRHSARRRPGAGVASTLVNVAMCGAAIWICYARRPFKKYRVLGRFWRPDWRLLRQLFVIGVPISGAMLLEWGLFSSAALLVGWIGTRELAAHQIALQIVSLLFMIPAGISTAAT